MKSIMGILYVVATPIGNLEDITIRAIKTILAASVVACEDTRRTGQLVKILSERYPEYSVAGNRRYLSVRDWNESKIVERILVELAAGDVALVSDAGTPLISDPGYKTVRAARDAGFTVVPIPGPSAIIAALSAAGLPTNKFIFLGFLGKKWELLPGYTHVIYESPNRTDKTCRTIRTKYPKAEMMIVQELTKIHEKITEYAEGMTFKGEVTLLVYLAEEIAADHGNRNRNGQQRENGGGNVG